MEGRGRGAERAKRATGEEDKRERGIGEEPGHGLDENATANEGATRERDGNSGRETERERERETRTEVARGKTKVEKEGQEK